MTYQMRGMTFDQFEVGQVHETASRTVTEADIAMFAGLSGDYNPLHTNEEFMKSSPFGGRIAHGMLIASIGTGLGNQLGLFEGTALAVMQITLKFTGAVKAGDTVRMTLTCTELKESSKGGKGTATFKSEIFNQRDEQVLDSQWVVLLRKG